MADRPSHPVRATEGTRYHAPTPGEHLLHIHHTPTYCSWLNQVERWFAYLTQDLLQRSDHRSVQALERDIRNWVTAWNENPKPFMWTKTAEQILESIARLLKRINGAGH